MCTGYVKEYETALEFSAKYIVKKLKIIYGKSNIKNAFMKITKKQNYFAQNFLSLRTVPGVGNLSPIVGAGYRRKYTENNAVHLRRKL
jgi:hypothetical protein